MSPHHTCPTRSFLGVNHPEDVEESLRSYGLDGEDMELFVVNDSEGILRIGNQGVVTEPRTVSAAVAIAVAQTADQQGLAEQPLADPVKRIHQAMWRPNAHSNNVNLRTPVRSPDRQPRPRLRKTQVCTRRSVGPSHP
jgi:hypothetical protein